MARAMWKGRLEVGSLAVPVRLFAAVEDRGLHFRLLHAADATPVKQQLVSVGGEPLSPERVLRGWAAEDRFVLLGDEELAAIEPQPSRTIELVRFVEPAAIGMEWYERPYWLGPDGDAPAYAALASALAELHLTGVARWVMRKRPYVGALYARDRALVLVRLRFAEEVVRARDVRAPEGREADPREVRLAEQLVGSLAGSFEPEAWRDTYRERVTALIEAKAHGRRTPQARPPKPRRHTPRSLASTLERSLAATKRKHG